MTIGFVSFSFFVLKPWALVDYFVHKQTHYFELQLDCAWLQNHLSGEHNLCFGVLIYRSHDCGHPLIVHLYTLKEFKVSSIQDWMQFRKAKTDEEGFYDYKTKQYWVEAGSPLKDYRGRPGAMEPLILSQLGLHFK